MIIKRTALAWTTYYDGCADPVADTVIAHDYLTHSPVLDANGNKLQYEPRPKIGFDLRPADQGGRRDG